MSGRSGGSVRISRGHRELAARRHHDRIRGVEQFEQFEEPGTCRGAFVPGAATHELDETTEGRLRLLREQFGVGCGELGFEVVRSGIGALDRILGNRARAGQETHLAQRGLRLGVVRLGVQDELVGRLGALEVAVLERLLGGLERGSAGCSSGSAPGGPDSLPATAFWMASSH